MNFIGKIQIFDRKFHSIDLFRIPFVLSHIMDRRVDYDSF